MEATKILMDEHRVIEHVLRAIDAIAARAARGEEVRGGFFLDAADFIKNFADGCHHLKEEGVLFVAMTEAGVPVEGGPIGVMLAEHEKGRAFTRGMRDATEKWQAGDVSQLEPVLLNAKGYSTLLRQHIHKEDNVLFPMADRVIPAERQGKIEEEFERIEREETGAGVHEKYHALAESLEKESLQT